MNNEIKEIYLSSLEWTKIHDNMGGVMGNLIFKDNMSYEEYEKLLKSGYFVLCNKDYITNLQEENERLKGNVSVMEHNYKLLTRLIENGESMTQKFENGLKELKEGK